MTDPNITTIREWLGAVENEHDNAEAVAAVAAVERELADLRAENDRLRIDLSQTNARAENYEAENERLRDRMGMAAEILTRPTTT